MNNNRKTTSYLYGHEKDSWDQSETDSYVSKEQLQELIANRKERYTEGSRKPEEPQKQPNKYVMLVLMGVVLVYFITAFVLNTTGVINKLTMILMVAPVLIVTLLVYFIHQKKQK